MPLRNEGVSSSFPAMTAELESIDADGFTFDWTTVSGSVRYFNYACLGGSIEAKLVRCQMNNTNVAESFAHGLSGAPTAVILFSVLNEQPVPASRTTLYASIGAWAGGSQFSGSIWSNNGVTTTATRRILSTTKALVRVAGSIDRSLSIASVDGTNVNVTYPDTTAINQYYFWMLCIRGCRAKVGTFTLGGVLTPTEITCPGIRPKFFMPVLIPGGHVSPDAILSTMLMGVGASDGLATTSSGLTEVNNVTTTLSRRWQSNNNLDDYDSAGNLMIRSDISFGEESVIVDPTTNTSSTWGQGGYLILGDAA
ncbi:MAG TPA: hypothetical protein DCQ98_06080 [Planctomycetaceae bacterium]|nr:hypothetical protein [Planctomycetaceae bacterium]